mmetsp:Transcript_7386/g.21835  ORF Transcript_7386/g.21835 Transcript_7386/m.21835 type:complete len:335 (+) Transcript_7386:290-1294(+)
MTLRRVLALVLCAVAVSSSGVHADRGREIRYFTTLFESSTPGWASEQHDAAAVSQTPLLSLASVPNLKGHLTILTHSTYRGVGALRLAAIEASGLSWPANCTINLKIIPDAAVGFDRYPDNWVLRIELFKLMYIKHQPPGARLVYVELDQLFLPGAGQAFAAVFESQQFDVAFTFLNNSSKFGSMNTGVILIRAGPRAIDLFKRGIQILRGTGSLPSKGGENQKAISTLMPELRWGDTWRGGASNATIHALRYPGPLNMNTKGCCQLGPETFVAHFKSTKKQWSKDKCCRDRVGVNRDAWKGACRCSQTNMSALPTCVPDQSSAPGDAVGWCEA